MKLPKTLHIGGLILASTGCFADRQPVLPRDQTAEAAWEIVDGVRQLESPRSCKNLYDILKERSDRLRAKINYCKNCPIEVQLSDGSIIKIIVSEIGDKINHITFRYDGPGKDDITSAGIFNGRFSVETFCKE